jgi:long-chain-fatty-acyl-CoA reductase
LSRALTAGYWEKDSPVWDQMIHASDLVCAWGQGASLEAIKRRIPQGVPFLEFGPKRSFAVVFANNCDPDQAALRVAHDVALYDQEACFSPQRVFVVGNAADFTKSLMKWLDHQAEYLPKGTTTDDVASHVLRCRMEAQFRGWKVNAGGSWTIIEQPELAAHMEHPLSRTIFIHQIESLDALNEFMDDETQTISVFPLKEFGGQVARAVCPHGAVRICESGTVSHPRQGFTHDGSYPVQQFVRLAYIDRELGYTYKYGPKLEVAELEQFLYGGTAGGSR